MRDGQDGRRAGEPTAAPARTGELQFTITRLGRPARRRQLRRGVIAALALAALAAGPAVLLARPAGHAARHSALPRSPAVSIPPPRGTSPPAARAPRPGRPGRPGHPGRPPAASTQIAGIGCPAGPGTDIILAAAATGPAWTAAGGGWTGNGCDGSSAWTMLTPGSHAAPSSVIWSFHPRAGTSHCSLAVFVPRQNALGLGEYVISSSAGTLATVPVLQAARAGQWVPLGTYPVAGTAVGIRFTPAAATLTAAGPPGGPPAGPPAARAPGPGHNSAVAASAALAACS